MKTRIWKRLLSLLLAIILCVQVLPVTAMAALLDNDPAYNEQMLAALEDIVGDEDEAERYYAILQQYGLLDEDGNMPESWEIWMDGAQVTLEEIEALLDSGDYDPDHQLLVDSTVIKLGDLKTILEIEEYLAYLQEKYFDGHQWTAEQKASLQSLMDQINTEGIMLLSAEDETGSEPVFASGVDETVKLTANNSSIQGYEADGVTTDYYPGPGGIYRVTVKLNKAQGADVTFDWAVNAEFLEMEEKYKQGTVCIPAGEKIGTFDIKIGKLKEKLQGKGLTMAMMYVQLFNLKNATFAYSGSFTESYATRTLRGIVSLGWVAPNVEVRGNERRLKYQASGTGNLTYTLDDDKSYYTTAHGSTDAEGNADLQSKDYSPNGDSITLKASYPSDTQKETNLRAGTYERIIRVTSATFSRTYASGTGAANQRESVQRLTPSRMAGVQFYVDGEAAGDPISIDFRTSGTLEVTKTNIELYRDTVELEDLPDKTNPEVFTISADLIPDIYERTSSGNPNYYQYLMPKMTACTVEVTYRETTTEATVKLSAPAGTYYTGQMIPISAEFSFPMKAATNSTVAYVNINGTNTAISGTSAYYEGSKYFCGGGYTVKEVDAGSLSAFLSDATYTGANGREITITSIDTTGLADVKLSTPPKEAAIVDFSAEVSGQELVATAKISSDKDYTQWMGDDFELDETTGVYTSKSLFASIDNENFFPLVSANGNVTGGTISAHIPLKPNTGTTDLIHGVELYLYDAEYDVENDAENDAEKGAYFVILGWKNQTPFKRKATATQKPVVFITDTDMDAPTLSVLDSTGQKDYEYADPANKVIYLQEEPQISASFTAPTDKDYSFGDIEGKVTTYDENGNLKNSEANFVWSSSNPSVANIDQEGKITPTGKSGKVYFTITALNGNVAGRAVSANSETLNFGVGLTPFLSIPNKVLPSVAGQDVTLFWTSNICDKNGEAGTTFNVTLKNGSGTQTWSNTVTGTAEKPAASVLIPGEYLKYDYTNPVNNKYTVTVTVNYAGKDYSATATIDLASKPAVVKLKELDSYYITDDDMNSVTLNWTISNFDRFGDSTTAAEVQTSDLFELLITRNGDTVYDSNKDTNSSPGTGDGKGTYTGSHRLDITSVSTNATDPTSYRDVYTVTIKAKNGTDSTWSYDSFLLYVYDADALKIWVDGKDESSVTLSNVTKISKMTQDQILALKRDISLKNIISINYGDYAWNELADQIAWQSSKNEVATVNYQQGTLYDNIDNFTYVSYRPTTEFGLSGISDGTATITATHKLTGMSDSLDVTVKTLKDKLYLFQCYPQAKTELTYTNGDGTTKTVFSDETGAAAIYEASGIKGDVSCHSSMDDKEYFGTFYHDSLVSGEGDWTKLERYPCNNLSLRQAAYAYLYVKKPDGTPYTGFITFRGGVYFNGEYVEDATFALNGERADNGERGDKDQTVKLGEDGKLTVAMKQAQWTSDGKINAWDKVSYVFEISQGDDKTEYYPMFLTINANISEDTFVGDGEAIVNFRENPEEGKHPYIAMQGSYYTNYSSVTSLLDETGKVGPSDNLPEAVITTAVMWWGGDEETIADEEKEPKLQLVTEKGVAIAAAEDAHVIKHTTYPFTDDKITQYTVKLNATSLKDVLNSGASTGVYLNYYADGTNLSRHESLPFQICNMLGVEKPEKSTNLASQLKNMGSYIGTDTKGAEKMDANDLFVSFALKMVASDNYSNETNAFNVSISPTSDPTKFFGFISVNVGNMRDSGQVTGVYAQTETSGKQDIDYLPGLSELMVMTKSRSLYSYLGDDFNKVLKRQGVRNLSMQLGGYAESLIYYDENTGKWEIQILSGGFNVGGGVSYSWNWNTMVGPVPFTATLTIGGTAEVSMDALSVAYYNDTQKYSGIGTDFLTELRIYLYLRFFAGVGVDYAVVAFKLGIFGQISLDMQFQWLNRPYMDDTPDTIINVADGTPNNPKKYTITELGGSVIGEFWQGENSKLAGQHFRIDGQIGLEFVVRVLFISFEQVLYSYNFNALNKSTGDWTTIQTNWEKNQAAQKAAISTLLGNRSLSVSNVGGQQMMTLNLAPTLESRDYLEDGGRVWGSGGISLFSLDDENGLKNLESNTYPYANPVVSDDGQLVVYLSDQNSSNVADTRAAFATKSGNSYNRGRVIDNGGYGDSQVSLSGTEDFAVAAWTRQTESINKDEGATLTAEDQIITMNSSEICAGVYDGRSWTTTYLTENASADLAPVVATNGSKAIVAWRAVSSSGEKTSDGYAAVTTFDEKDTILYRIYDGSNWGETKTLYNGTSGAVKGITAAMLDDGTAAVAYTLDSDKSDNTISDREIYYAVIGNDGGEVTRNVRATNDAYLDENPQLTAVTFPSAENKQRFVLGWYTEQAVASDSASTLDAGETGTTNTTISDIRLLDFDGNGIYTQLLPDSISKAADEYDVSITPTFRFTKNSGSINDLSILWVERAETTSENVDVEKDVLKGVKFYTYGQNDEIISFTGAIDVAEMGAGTLIDHFDAYVSDAANNEIKAVILGTTYGEKGVITKTAETTGGDTVSFTVPSSTTAMYTATETYSDKIDVPAVLADYETVKKGATTQIQFTVKNNGIHAISELEIKVGDTTTTTYSDLNLLPGDSIQLWADYTVPDNGVVDPEYTVTATFNESQGATGTAETGGRSGIFGFGAKAGSNVVTGTVYLDLPDVEITDAKIVEEKDGERTIQIKLNNDSDATLTKSNRSVKIGFYTDATRETPFPAGYGLNPITVSDSSDLAMLDGGGYSVQATFDVGKYLAEKLSTADNQLTEIPDSGITVYIKAEVLEDGKVLPQPIYSNDNAEVVCENLKLRTGKDVSVTSNFEVKDGNTVVTAYLQNNSLSQTTTGNVIVTLLDADGKVIAQQQSYTGVGNDNGLITLDKEEKRTETFTFADVTNAASVEVVYSNLLLDADNANLASLTFSNIPGLTLDDFEPSTMDESENPVYRATVTTDDLTATTVMAVTETALAKAAASSGTPDPSKGGNTISTTVSLIPGQKNTVTVSVVADNGTMKTYILTINNNGEPEITIDKNMETGYSASVVYNGDNSATVKLTAVAKPETPGYSMTYQWYSCDDKGEKLEEIPAEIASNTTSAELTVSSKLDAGVHYYICKVTREMLDGTTTDYKSSVASVEITKAGGNSVTVEGLTVDYDRESHRLPEATADRSGSKIFYSTDYGTAETPIWSEEAPSFTDVGVHTVWVKATHKNYKDTEIRTADVLIQGAPTISTPTVTINEGFGTSVVYASSDSATISITATRNPIQAQYQLSYQWYECDAAGSEESRTELTGKIGSTLTVPSTVDAGMHYYICKVTRKMVDDSTTDYWSSVASVQIAKATDNSVMCEAITVPFDNTPHSLTPTAAKSDSTLHYSIDGGKTWSETAPAFTSVGVHTVWIYATNPNYENTAVVTADVVIQEKEGTQFRLSMPAVSELYSSYPEEIRKQYGNADSLSAALIDAMKKMGVSEKNTAVSGAKLEFSLDGGTTWREATAENFPAAGMTVTIPYPEGTNRSGYNFILNRLVVDPLNSGKTAGDIEAVDISLMQDGIRFTADCLSALVLGWSRRSTSSPSYTVAAEDAKHGTFTVSPSRASYNSTVTITANPDEGYKVGSVTVTAQNGRELTVTDQGNNIYTFKMPSGSVSVEVDFVPLAQGCSGGADCPSRAFTDLDVTKWYHEAVDYVLKNGLMSGTGANTFAPNTVLSRAMIAQILYNKEGRPAVAGKSGFADVADGAWYTDAIIWASANGIIAGYPDGRYGPNDPITREQLASILYRYAGSPAVSGTLPFSDAQQASAYALDALKWATQAGVINGVGDGTLNPRGSATRAVVAQMLKNLLENTR